MGKNELDFNFGGYATLEDLETGETIEINTQQAADYQQKLKSHLEVIRMQLLGKHIYYRMLSTAQSLDEALRDFLTQRHKSKF
jgi:hypothetical protein